MATGYWIVKGDKTSCGGSVLSGRPEKKIGQNLNPVAVHGSPVSCGKHPGTYSVGGGHPGDIVHGSYAASTLYSRSTCPCNAFFIPSQTFMSHGMYQSPSVKIASSVAPKAAEPEQHAQVAKKAAETPSPVADSEPKIAPREAVDAGFCVLPYGASSYSYEPWLFMDSAPEDVRALFKALNGTEQFKAGSILLLVDPLKQDAQQISHMKKAKARVDVALAPLTHEEANFLHQHKDTIDLFTSQTSLYGGTAVEAAGKYFERIESILSKIQSTYKNQYLTSGTLIGQQFFVERKLLFKELDGVLTDFTKHKLGLRDYPDIRRSLGLSSSAITHRWNQTGVSDIEGYATYMEKAAKYVKLMKKLGYVGIALDGANRMDKVYEACTVGTDCAEVSLSEVGSFAGGIGLGMWAGSAAASSSAMVCSVVLGALTIEAGGAGMLACGIVFTGAVGYGAGEVGNEIGGAIGKKIYEVTK